MPNDFPHTLKHTVATGEAGDRLDRVLAAAHPAISRARFQTLIAQGEVRVNGDMAPAASYRVKEADEILVAIPAPKEPRPLPESMPLDVVYEDDHIIVIDKPAGMVVHPAPGHGAGTLVNALIAHCGNSLSGIGGIRRPGIVHRLDRDTSGILVVAKTDEAHRNLSAQFKSHGRDGRLERRYTALIWGSPSRLKGKIDAPIGRSTGNRRKMAVTDAGKPAVTHYLIVKRYPDAPVGAVASLAELTLETGRTHQIRVHMREAGHPVMGDSIYGSHFASAARKLPEGARDRLAALGRQALHASTLRLVHPVTGEGMQFSSPLPDDMARLVSELEKLTSDKRWSHKNRVRS